MELSISSFIFVMNFTEVLQRNQTQRLWSSSLIHFLHLIYVPCLAFFGITGNILCAFVFTTKSLRRIHSSSYLFVLALNDVIFLVDLLPGWISMSVARHFYRAVTFLCQIQTYISFVAAFLHIWMVLAFTAERFVAVNFPLKHMSQCTTRLSRTILILIASPACLFYIYPSVFASEVDQDDQCREKPSHVRFLNHINMIDTILTMFIPFLLVSILNLLIIRKLFCSKEFRQHVFENGTSYQYHMPSDWTPSRSAERQRLKHHPHDSVRRHVLTEVRLTKMLLAISLTCLSLNFPSYYSRLMTFYEQTKEDPLDIADDSTWLLYREIIFHYMSYLSYSINIVIYILFGVNFRRALKRIFCPKRAFSSNIPSIKSARYSIGEHTGSFRRSPFAPKRQDP